METFNFDEINLGASYYNDLEQDFSKLGKHICTFKIIAESRNEGGHDVKIEFTDVNTGEVARRKLISGVQPLFNHTKLLTQGAIQLGLGQVDNTKKLGAIAAAGAEGKQLTVYQHTDGVYMNIDFRPNAEDIIAAS